MLERSQLIDNMIKISSFEVSHPYKGGKINFYLFGSFAMCNPESLYDTSENIENALNVIKKYISEEEIQKRIQAITSHKCNAPKTKNELLDSEDRDVQYLRKLYEESSKLFAICKTSWSTVISDAELDSSLASTEKPDTKPEPLLFSAEKPETKPELPTEKPEAKSEPSPLSAENSSAETKPPKPKISLVVNLSFLNELREKETTLKVTVFDPTPLPESHNKQPTFNDQGHLSAYVPAQDIKIKAVQQQSVSSSFKPNHSPVKIVLEAIEEYKPKGSKSMSLSNATVNLCREERLKKKLETMQKQHPNPLQQISLVEHVLNSRLYIPFNDGGKYYQAFHHARELFYVSHKEALIAASKGEEVILPKFNNP